MNPLKTKKAIFSISLTLLILFYLWLSLGPVEIKAVHKEGNQSYVLVSNFPFTDKGKIRWWLEHKTRLQAKYNIPEPSAEGSFTVVFWFFGDGYRAEGKYDRFCFTDMSTKNNCIDKDAALFVTESRNTGTYFSVAGGTYRLDRHGEIVELKDTSKTTSW